MVVEQPLTHLVDNETSAWECQPFTFDFGHHQLAVEVHSFVSPLQPTHFQHIGRDVLGIQVVTPNAFQYLHLSIHHTPFNTNFIIHMQYLSYFQIWLHHSHVQRYSSLFFCFHFMSSFYLLTYLFFLVYFHICRYKSCNL